MEMKLTKNDKKTLKLLLSNSRISDRDIASKLNLSSQAVGKIRRKLESSVIDSYTANLNYHKLGIQTFAIGVAKITKEGWQKGKLELEQLLLKDPHIINAYRVLKGGPTYILLYGFQDMGELDNFFHSPNTRTGTHKYIETQELTTFSNNSLIKNCPNQLFHKVLDSI